MRRYLTERLRDPGSDRTLCSAPLPPSPPVVGGGDDDDVDWVARGLSSSGDGSIVASMLRWSSASLSPSGGDGGGGREARRIPGWGEEDKYRGRNVQGGVDEAQRGQDEEEGSSGGGWAWDGVPGAGGKLGRGGRRRWPGTGRPRGGCPPIAFWRGGSLLPPLVDCRVPIVGDGSDGGD